MINRRTVRHSNVRKLRREEGATITYNSQSVMPQPHSDHKYTCTEKPQHNHGTLTKT